MPDPCWHKSLWKKALTQPEGAASHCKLSTCIPCGRVVMWCPELNCLYHYRRAWGSSGGFFLLVRMIVQDGASLVLRESMVIALL